MFDELLNLSINQLLNYIINLKDKNLKDKILKNKEIRNKFLDNNNHTYFIKLINNLNEDLLSFLDKDIIDNIIDNKRCHDKLKIILLCKNELKNEFLKDTRLIKIMHEYNDLIEFIKKLNYSFSIYYFNYLKEINDIINFKNLKVKYQINLLKNLNIRTLIIENFNLSNKIALLDIEVINYLMNDIRFLDNIINLNLNSLSILAKKGIKLPVNKDFISKYLDILNITKYRHYIDFLDYSNLDLKEEIEKRRKLFYDNKINLINENNLSLILDLSLLEIDDFDYLNSLYEENINQEELLIKKNEDYFLEILIDRYFEDIPYNFLVNLKMMRNFLETNNLNIIDNKNLEIYNKILSFYKLNIKEKMELYNYLKTFNNLKEIFYDDYKRVKEYAYSLYNQKLISPRNMYKETDLTNEFGINTYVLNGEEFYVFVHVTDELREGDTVNNLWSDSRETISLSLISHNHIGVIRDPLKYIVFGFKKLDIDKIMHMYHSDSYTTGLISTSRINEIFSPSDLIKNTKAFNEILYLENNLVINQELKPDFIICYDTIYEREIEIAKNYNLELVLLNTKNYKQGDDFIDSHLNNYIEPGDENVVLRNVGR